MKLIFAVILLLFSSSLYGESGVTNGVVPEIMNSDGSLNVFGRSFLAQVNPHSFQIVKSPFTGEHFIFTRYGNTTGHIYNSRGQWIGSETIFDFNDIKFVNDKTNKVHYIEIERGNNPIRVIIYDPLPTEITNNSLEKSNGERVFNVHETLVNGDGRLTEAGIFFQNRKRAHFFKIVKNPFTGEYFISTNYSNAMWYLFNNNGQLLAKPSHSYTFGYDEVTKTNFVVAKIGGSSKKISLGRGIGSCEKALLRAM